VKHGHGSAWVIYYCAVCRRYYLEGSGKCEICQGAIDDPEECCHYGDAEVEVKIKKK